MKFRGSRVSMIADRNYLLFQKVHSSGLIHFLHDTLSLQQGFEAISSNFLSYHTSSQSGPGENERVRNEFQRLFLFWLCISRHKYKSFFINKNKMMNDSVNYIDIKQDWGSTALFPFLHSFALATKARTSKIWDAETRFALVQFHPKDVWHRNPSHACMREKKKLYNKKSSFCVLQNTRLAATVAGALRIRHILSVYLRHLAAVRLLYLRK